MNRVVDSADRILKYRVYIVVWLGLIGLTYLTVTIAGFHAGRVSIFFPLVISTIKASMVLSFFMHLRYEKGLFKLIVPISIVIFAVLTWLIFSDVVYR